MLLSIKIEGDENTLLNEIKSKISKQEYEDILNEINKFCEDCQLNKAISLVSLYHSDWKGTKMQKIYEICDGDKEKTRKFAGIILKDAIIQNSKYYFECVKSKGKNCYYKRGEK